MNFILSVTSIRLENYRDGVEDYELLAMLRDKLPNQTAIVRAFIAQVVTGFSENKGINVTADMSLDTGFEHTRREVARVLSRLT